MLVFNTNETGAVEVVDPGTVFLFPTTLNDVAMWCVAATFILSEEAPFLREELDYYNVCGLFPCVNMAVIYARMLEKGEVEGVEKIKYGSTVH